MITVHNTKAVKSFVAFFGAILILLNLPALALGAALNIETDKLFLAENILIDAGSNQAKGNSQVFSIPGQFILAIPLQYTVNWDEQTPKIKIPREKIQLIDGQGNSIPVLGELNYYSGLKTFFSGISSSRPSNWQDSKAKPKKLYLVFPVTTPGAKYTLQIGEQEATVTAPKKPISFGPEIIASFKVTGAERVDNVQAKLKIEKTEYMTMVRPITGTYLAVKIAITPTPPTKFESSHFYWNTSWFAIQDENRSFVPVAGEIFFDKLTNNVSHNKSKSSSGWKMDEATLYFSVAGQSKKFTLYCLGKPVTEFALP